VSKNSGHLKLAMSKTTVVNINTSAYEVYIGRTGHGMDGYFGNPIRFDYKCPICKQVHVDTEQGRFDLLQCYKKYFWKRLHCDFAFYERVKKLKGKRLGCFCAPKPCHGDVIKAWLDAGCPMLGERK
jgi:hypothetical protein